jgi:hypothetical protein
MQVLEANLHRTNIDAEVFESIEEVVEVVRRQGEFGGFDGARCE